jgi:hypothetical protein
MKYSSVNIFHSYFQKFGSCIPVLVAFVFLIIESLHSFSDLFLRLLHRAHESLNLVLAL